jgi:hypothetical protein
MPILKVCDCGKRMKVSEKSLGKKIKCPDCGLVSLVEEPEPEEDEEEARPKKKKKTEASGKKKKRRHADEGTWSQTPILGMRLGAWLMLLAGVGIIGLVGVLVVPKALSKNTPAYELIDKDHEVWVVFWNTPAGDFTIALKKKRLPQLVNQVAGMPEFEMPNIKKEGDKTARGKTVHWLIESTSGGITDVQVDGQNLRPTLSAPW